MFTRILSLLFALIIATGCSRPETTWERTGESATAERTLAVPEPEPAPAPAVQKPQRLVNDGTWKITASTQEAEFTAEMAADGDPGTRWSSAFDDHQWWMVDFGRPELLNSLTLQWEAAHAARYQVLVSPDGSAWAEIARRDESGGGTEELTFKPVRARFVKLALEKRATQWGFSLLEVSFNDVEQIERFPMEASSSSGNDAYSAEKAIDGNYQTRWSSNFGDDEWWMVEFDKPRMVSGLKIYWETAFGEKYEIQLSDDGEKWKTVYEVTEGDGQTDLIFFRPTAARYLRLRGIQRGTGWGYSIWEAEILAAPAAADVSADSSADSTAPGNALDGDPETAWHSAGDGEQTLAVRLPRKFDVGGLQLKWGADYAVAYALDLSLDGRTWKTVFETDKGNGEQDYAFFPAHKARAARVRCLKSSAGAGYALAEIEFKGGEEQANPLREYKAAAQDAPRGRFPRWLTREQEFWTVVGLVDDDQETLLSESGGVEPCKGSFCVTPLVHDGARLVGWADVTLEQHLQDGTLPLPTARWDAGSWNMEVAAVAFGPLNKSSTAVRYRIANQGAAAFRGHLGLAVRPVQMNPIWQSGGVSPIRTAQCLPGRPVSLVKIDGRTKIVSLTPPAAMGAAALERGDVSEFFAMASVPPALEASEADGRVSVGLWYAFDIPPGESTDVVVVYPMHDASEWPGEMDVPPSKWFDGLWDKQAAGWSALLNRFSIEIPEKRLIDVMKSNIAYILINKDGPWVKPGSRNYSHAWIRDGSMTCVALLRMGLYETVKKYLLAYAPLVNEAGHAPYIIFEGGHPAPYNPDPNVGEGQEYDSQGQFVFLLRQYFDFSGDRALAEQFYPKVVKALRFAQQLRRARMTDEYKNDPAKKPYYGILPLSNSHEGYYPAMHSHWDNFWVLRGFKDGAYLAEQLGHPEDAAWMREEEKDFRTCVLDSILAVIKRDGIDYIPGCVEKGDFDATSTAIAIMACGEGEYLPQPYLQNTFDRYFAEFSKGTEPGHERSFTPYEVRSADAFVRMGQRERGLAMLRYFTQESVRPYHWNHLAEVVHARPRAPSYIGDMPHTWVGSGYISAVRNMFAYEDAGRLVIAAGVDPAWLKQGVSVEGLPTLYGKIDYKMTEEGGDVLLQVSGEAAPPRGFSLPLPAELAGRTAEVNGQAAELTDGAVLFTKLPASIRLRGVGE